MKYLTLHDGTIKVFLYTFFSLKNIIATSVLKIGIAVLKINDCILCKVPRQMVEIVQEIGRVGRDGSPALAVLITGLDTGK